MGTEQQRIEPGAADRTATLVELVEAQRATIESLQAAVGAQSAGDRQAALQAMAHELATPLTAIIGMLELVVSGELDEATAADFVRRAHRQAEHLGQTVGDVLDVARAEPSVPRAPLEWVAVAELADDAIEAAGPRLPGRQVSRDVPGDLRVRTAPSRVRGMLVNLLVNAGKYSPAGTPVSVAARREDGWVHLEVADRGPGVPEESVEELFQPFRRGQVTHAEGHGIGLYLVRRLAESLGGRATLLARSGGGTVARVSLPQQRTEDQWA